MKTKDLIAALQEVDPTGEEQCCIQNADIWNVGLEPAYYDGAVHIIEFDKNHHPIRGRRQRSGNKVTISSISIQDGLEYDNFVIDYTDDTDRARHEKFDLECCRKDKEINFEVGMSIFASWVFLKIQSMKPIPLGWVERIKQAAEAFYKEHRGPDVDGKAIEDFPWQNHSYADRLEALWEETIRVEWDNYSRVIIEYKEKHNDDT